MTTAIYSMVNSIASTTNGLIDKTTKLEQSLNLLLQGGNTGAVTKNIAHDNPDISLFKSRLDQVETKLESALKLLSTTSVNKPSVDGAHMQQLTEELKMLKSSTADMNKERLLLETALTHKLEQHVNRIFKERIDILLREQKDEIMKYIDSSIQDVKTLLNNAVALIGAQQQALVSSESTRTTVNEQQYHSAPIDQKLDIESITKENDLGDFDIEIQTTSQKSSNGTSKRVVRKK